MLDSVDFEQVCVFALRPDGSAAMKRLSEHPDAERLRGKLSAGELWTSDPESKWVFDSLHDRALAPALRRGTRGRVDRRVLVRSVVVNSFGAGKGRARYRRWREDYSRTGVLVAHD